MRERWQSLVSPVEVSWCPRVSQGLMTGQQRANCPSQGMPSPTQAKFTQPPELPSSAVGIGGSVFGSSGGERFWSAVIVEMFLVHQVWIWGWICQINTPRLTLPWTFMKQRNQWQVKSVRSWGAIEVSQVVTQLSTDMKTTGRQIFKDSGKMLLFSGGL